MRQFGTFLLFSLLVLTGCQKANSPTPTAQVLIETDAAFAKFAAVSGTAAAFREFAAPEALVLPQGGQPVRGRENIVALMRGETGALSWTPRNAEISQSADMGYTWGVYQYRAAPNVEVNHGKYVTIWKKQADGTWKFVVDVGNKSPAPE